MSKITNALGDQFSVTSLENIGSDQCTILHSTYTPKSHTSIILEDRYKRKYEMDVIDIDVHKFRVLKLVYNIQNEF